jgi:hypothetical protein
LSGGRRRGLPVGERHSIRASNDRRVIISGTYLAISLLVRTIPRVGYREQR